MTTYTISETELQALLEAAADMGAKMARKMKTRAGGPVAQSTEVQAWAQKQLTTRAEWEAAQALKTSTTPATYPGTKTIVK